VPVFCRRAPVTYPNFTEYTRSSAHLLLTSLFSEYCTWFHSEETSTLNRVYRRNKTLLKGRNRSEVGIQKDSANILLKGS
jgi:hypothetical protein